MWAESVEICSSFIVIFPVVLVLVKRGVGGAHQVRGMPATDLAPLSSRARERAGIDGVLVLQVFVVNNGNV